MIDLVAGLVEKRADSGGTSGTLRSMSSSFITRLNSLFALNDAISRCSSGASCSFTVCALEL